MENNDETELPEGEPLSPRDICEIAASVPTMWIDETNWCISIPVPTAADPVTLYSVDFIRLEKPVNLLAWVVHLAGKPWMDRRRLREFIRLAAKGRNFKLPNT